MKKMTSKKLFRSNEFAWILLLLFIISGHSTFAHDPGNEQYEPVSIQQGKAGKAPSDAIVLFGKSSLNQF